MHELLNEIVSFSEIKLAMESALILNRTFTKVKELIFFSEVHDEVTLAV